MNTKRKQRWNRVEQIQNDNNQKRGTPDSPLRRLVSKQRKSLQSTPSEIKSRQTYHQLHSNEVLVRYSPFNTFVSDSCIDSSSLTFAHEVGDITRRCQ